MSNIEINERTLCGLYKVAIYPIEALEEYPSEAEKGTFLVTTLANTFLDCPDSIPAAASEDEAFALAVKHLKLRELYARQIASGQPPGFR